MRSSLRLLSEDDYQPCLKPSSFSPNGVSIGGSCCVQFPSGADHQEGKVNLRSGDRLAFPPQAMIDSFLTHGFIVFSPLPAKNMVMYCAKIAANASELLRPVPCLAAGCAIS